MDETHRCQRCGTLLNKRAPAGLCPRCLLESATRLVGISVDGQEVARTQNAETRAKQAKPLPLGALGNYELIERIASGGMGAVYRARQQGLNRIVALKVLPFGPFTREELVKRFQIEAAAAAKLRHPNIVTIFEVGKADGYPFFSMEFVEGTTLAGLVREQPLPMNRAVRLARTVAEAIHYAHQQGILHRDLKSSNVLVDALDQPRITDFGLARDLAHDSELTLTGQALGSPNFMSPEQAMGRHTKVTARSDVYGLGAVLYHLITGRPPFSSDSGSAVLQQVLENDPAAPRLLNSSIPRDLETICLKCLEKEPARRYSTAQELAEDLGRWQRGEPIVARPIGVAGRAGRWCRRHPAIAALLATLMIVLSAGFAATLGQWRRAERAVDRLAQIVTRLEIDRAEDLLERGETPDGLAQLASVLRREPENRVAATRILALLHQRRFILPEETVIQEDFVGRNSAFAQHGDWMVTTTNRAATLQLWNTREGLRLERLMAAGEAVRVASFRADGQQLVAATANGKVMVFDVSLSTSSSRGDEAKALSVAENGKEITASRRLQQTEPIAGPHKIGGYIDRVVLSPDGARVIAHVSGPNSGDWKRAKLIVADVVTGRVFREETNMHWAALSPDGKWLVTVGGQTAQLRDPIGWEPVGPALRHGARINKAEFSPDARLLVTASADSTARLWRADTGERVATLRHDLQVLSAVFSPDGQRVLTKDLGRGAQLWNVTNGLAVGPALPQARGVSVHSFSADGKLLIHYLESKAWIRNAISGALVTEPLESGQVIARAQFIGTEGQLLTSTFGGVAQVWKLSGLTGMNRDLRHRAEISAVAVSPDSTMIAAAVNDRTARVWDATSGEPIASLGHESEVLRVAFDPAGRRVVTASSDRTARVWHLPSGRLVGEPLGHGHAVFDARFSPDGRWLATCAEDRTAQLWNAETLDRMGEPLRHGGNVRAAAFRKDGKVVATAGIDNMVRLWSVPEGQSLGEPLRHSNWVSNVGFSPDGKLLASCGSERGARLWDLSGLSAEGPSSKIVEPSFLFLRHAGHVRSIQFDESGTRVLTASDDRTARLWSVTTGTALARPLRHGDSVVWAGFSPDGRTVLTASSDSTVRLWDAATGHALTDALRHDDIVTSAAWAPSGEFLVTGSFDRTVRVWASDFLKTSEHPSWLADLAEAVGGKRLMADDVEAPVSPAEFLQLRNSLSETGRAKDSSLRALFESATEKGSAN